MSSRENPLADQSKLTSRDLTDGMTVRREDRIRDMASKRQQDVIVILENVHDPHNIGAVLRSCDSVGVTEVIALYTDDHLDEETLQTAIRSKTSSGAYRWVKTSLYSTVDDCISYLRQKKLRLLGTHLHAESKSIYHTNLTEGVAIFFGNEKLGLSEQVLSELDGNVFIPQVGMVKSLNISVACAVFLYEMYRQREQKDMYSHSEPDPELFNSYLKNHKF